MTLHLNRLLLAAACSALLGAVACSQSGSPAAPSLSPLPTSPGATINGLVNAAATSTGKSEPAAATTSTLTVTVEGTGPSAIVDASGRFQLAGVPSGDVRLRFSGGGIDAAVLVANVGQDEQIQLQVSISGASAVVVSDVRSGSKVDLCHKEDGVGYHLIEVSTSAEPAHRAHGDGKVGEPVPGAPGKVFSASCQVVGAITIKKSTNGQDANEAPGPSIQVGAAVTWTYVVTNNGGVALNNVKVVDDKGVTVNCGAQTTLAAGASMTCTGTGVAALGQYVNIGTATADAAGGASVSDRDFSHYLGVAAAAEQAPAVKVQLCHRTGNGRYQPIEVSSEAEPAHRAHGDGKVGEAVPGNAGKVFLAGCSVG